jgi:secondary thiamine-phosphate synthase enzyme
VASGAGAEVTTVRGVSARCRPMLRAPTTPAPMTTSSSSHHQDRPPPPREERATRRRAGDTPAEYRPGPGARECYKRFTTPAMLRPLTIETSKPRQFVDVTTRVQAVVQTATVADGVCVVYSPHTTAGITINENADPDVVADLLRAYTDLLGDEARFRHAEGNSGGHALTSLVGPSVCIPIQRGRLVLGRWQAVYLCEFDGPRQRTIQVQVIGEGGSRGGVS